MYYFNKYISLILDFIELLFSFFLEKNETKLANAVCEAKISLEKNRTKDEIFGRFVEFPLKMQNLAYWLQTVHHNLSSME